MSNREFLSNLRARPEFAALMKELLANQPTVTEYTPREDDPVGRWKFESGQRAGYLLCLRDLGAKID